MCPRCKVHAGYEKEDLKKVRLSRTPSSSILRMMRSEPPRAVEHRTVSLCIRQDLAQERELLVTIDAGVITIFVGLTVVSAVYLAVAET
jgi:hypothetical protein